LRVGLGIRQHAAIGGDNRDSRTAGGYLPNPFAQGCNVLRLSRESWRPLGRTRLRDAGNSGELFETCALVIIAESPLRKKSHGEQDASQQREEREREFPE